MSQEQQKEGTDQRAGATPANTSFRAIEEFIRLGSAEVEAQKAQSNNDGAPPEDQPETPASHEQGHPSPASGDAEDSAAAQTSSDRGGGRGEQSRRAPGGVPGAAPSAEAEDAERERWGKYYRLENELSQRTSEIETLRKQADESTAALERHKRLLREDPVRAAEEAGTTWDETVKSALESPETLRLAALVQRQEEAMAELKNKQEKAVTDFEKYREEQEDKIFLRGQLTEGKERWPRLYGHKKGVDALYLDLSETVKKGGTFETSADALEKELWKSEMLEKLEAMHGKGMPDDAVLESVLRPKGKAPPPKKPASLRQTLAEQSGEPGESQPTKPTLPGNSNAHSTDPGSATLSDWEVYRAKHPKEPVDSPGYVAYIMSKYPELRS